MKTNTNSENRLLIQFMPWAVTGCVGLMLLLPLGARGAGVVTDCAESSLRTAMAGGGTITFACDGTITLTSTITNALDTVLDGSGHQVTISGGNTVSVFCVNANVNFSMVNLTIANGYALNGPGNLNFGGTVNVNSGGTVNATNCTFSANSGRFGGAILNSGGTVNAINCTFSTNTALVVGGAICNQIGLVQLLACQFAGNQARGELQGVAGGESASGGAIYNSDTVILDLCTFAGNSASGVPGGSLPGTQPGGIGSGGAIFNNGTLQVRRSAFAGNGAYGAQADGDGCPGGGGLGGAICNQGTLWLDRSTLQNNGASGGAGGTGWNGQPWNDIATDGGAGGAGGPGAGGGLFNSGTATAVNSSFAGNSGSGGPGGTGGTGGVGLRFSGNGGPGGNGGDGYGAVYNTSAGFYLTNCTLAFNSGSGGAAGAGGMGGGGKSPGYPGPAGTGGNAAGGINWALVVNTLLATNSPRNSSGTLNDLGHNLSSDGSCYFTAIGSMNNTDPKLGPLADNGGPTLTMALLPGSPAINAGDPSAAPPTDQRGVPRPQGPGVDIGAFEYQYVPAFSGAKVQNHTNFWLQMSGLLPGQAFTLQSSTNLVDWIDVTNFTAGESLVYEFVDGNLGTCAIRFYRLKCSTP